MENTTNEPRKGLSMQWIYIGIIVLLVAAGIYLFVSKNKEEDKNELLTTQVEATAADKVTIETEYNAALARLDEMKNQSVQMDSLLTTKNEEVEDLKKRIDAIVKNKNATDAELKQARSMITELNGKLNNFQTQITALKQENVQLTEDKKNLIAENTEVTNEKKDLEKKVELGSVLHASGFKLEAINIKKNLLGKEKEKETEKAKKADLIRVSFDLDDNRISESGEKIIYICIVDPRGNVVSNGNKFKMQDGSDKAFTTSKTVPYKKGEKVYGLSTEWKPNMDFVKGDYNVEVYHQGYRIGGEKVTLK